MKRKIFSKPCAHLPHLFKGFYQFRLRRTYLLNDCYIFALFLFAFISLSEDSIGNPNFMQYLDSAEKWDEDYLFSTFIIKKKFMITQILWVYPITWVSDNLGMYPKYARVSGTTRFTTKKYSVQLLDLIDADAMQNIKHILAHVRNALMKVET